MNTNNKCVQRMLFPETGPGPKESSFGCRKTQLGDELQFLLALLANSFATMDDASDDLSAVFADGGKWRGAITLRLSQSRIIEAVGSTNSRREARHRGLLRIWRVRNRPAAVARVTLLQTLLAELDMAGNETSSTMPVVEPVQAVSTQNPGGN